MDYLYKKSRPVKLREIGKDEKWLQEKINEDPSILGLGDLLVLQRERLQPTGGRIDFLMYNPEEETRYEIEIMLGKLDESHIIRTIEYWDIERKRYPSLEHRAVIVAEEITNRFFNVIGILNRAVPIIALQLNSFVLEDHLTLNFVKVLDVMQEEIEEDAESQEQVDRKYWENRASEKSIQVMDRIIGILPKEKVPRITYNRYHVALGSTGRQFCWFHLRKGSYVHLHLKVGSEMQPAIIKNLEERSIETGVSRNDSIIKIVLTMRELEDNLDYFKELVMVAEELSTR